MRIVEARSETEARFWAAVENADLPELSGLLAVAERPLDEVLPALTAWRALAVGVAPVGCT